MKREYLENVQTPFVTSRMTVGVSAMLICYVEEVVPRYDFCSTYALKDKSKETMVLVVA